VAVTDIRRRPSIFASSPPPVDVNGAPKFEERENFRFIAYQASATVSFSVALALASGRHVRVSHGMRV
jgi:hypothetical protein